MGKQTTEEWVREKEALGLMCGCGCGEPLKILPSQRHNGIPTYLKGHFGKGKPLSEERKANIAASLTGRRMGEGFRQKRREHMVKRWGDEDYRKRMSEMSTRVNSCPTRRAQQSEFLKSWYAENPEHRAKVSAAARKWASENPHKKIQAAKAGHRAVAVSKKPSSIEVILQQELERRGVSFDPQWEHDLGVADFRVGCVIVFADGTYWHDYPHGTDKDRKQDAFLIGRGYAIIRLWEHEIRNDVRACVDRVLHAYEINGGSRRRSGP